MLHNVIFTLYMLFLYRLKALANYYQAQFEDLAVDIDEEVKKYSEFKEILRPMV